MKLFKNRTALGIFCIAVSLIICFAIIPLVNAGLSKKITIVRFNQQINEGEEITRNMLDEVEVGNHNLPENVIRNVAKEWGYRIRHCTGLPWQWRNDSSCGA